MGNIQLHRVPMAKWLPPNGLTGKMHHMDARVGGGYKMSFTHFTTGKSHAFGGTYVELQRASDFAPPISSMIHAGRFMPSLIRLHGSCTPMRRRCTGDGHGVVHDRVLAGRRHAA